MLFATFLLYLSGREDHVRGAPSCTKSTLTLWDDTVAVDVVVKPIQQDTCQYFACNAEERNATVIVAAGSISLALIDVYYQRVFEVLWLITRHHTVTVESKRGSPTRHLAYYLVRFRLLDISPIGQFSY